MTPPALSRPEGPVVFFDGHCGLCNGFVDFVMARDPKKRFRFAPLQGKTAALLVPDDAVPEAGPGETAVAPRSIVLWEGGRVRRRSDAVLRVLAEQGAAWKTASILFLVPRILRDFVYAFIARHRYRWFGRREACRMPAPGERARFLP